MRLILIFLFILPPLAAADHLPIADKVVVKKSLHKLYLLRNKLIIKQYDISLGGNIIGHKEKEGDQRTPEGQYILDYKKNDSAYYKALHISYPNTQDKNNAQQKGVNPGGAIMIHGQKNGYGWASFIVQLFDWTQGCIAVTNTEIDEIWHSTKVGTPIEILP